MFLITTSTFWLCKNVIQPVIDRIFATKDATDRGGRLSWWSSSRHWRRSTPKQPSTRTRWTTMIPTSRPVWTTSTGSKLQLLLIHLQRLRDFQNVSFCTFLCFLQLCCVDGLMNEVTILVILFTVLFLQEFTQINKTGQGRWQGQ